MTEAEATSRDEVEKSIKAVREIDELIDSPLFHAYYAKIESKAASIARTVLEGRIPAEEREELRHQRIGLLMALRMVADDREGHISILRSHGVDV